MPRCWGLPGAGALDELVLSRFTAWAASGTLGLVCEHLAGEGYGPQVTAIVDVSVLVGSDYQGGWAESEAPDPARRA